MKKIIIITGGNSGLGYKCAENILRESDEYHLILACRNIEKASLAQTELIKNTNNENVSVLQLDVASLVSVHKFIDQLKAIGITSIYGLICNAGINGMATGSTVDGFDVIFETNHLGHFLLTNLLLPLMTKGRILVVSSDMHNPPSGELTWLEPEILAHPDLKLSTDSIRYSYSKLCNLYFTYELAKKLKEQDLLITINAFNPGLMIDTNFAPNKTRFTKEFLDAVTDRIGSLEESSKALCELMINPQYSNTSGKYFDRGTTIIESSKLSYDEQNSLALWQKSCEYTGLK